MQVYDSLEDINFADSWLTIGSFDGVHLGHQAIIRAMVEGAHTANLPAVVLTFDPHPIRVVSPKVKLSKLTSLIERKEVFEEMGVDYLIIHPFDTEIAKWSAEKFLDRLKSRLGFSQLYVGYDFAIGNQRKGDIKALREFGLQFEFNLKVFEAVIVDGETVSSSLIRELIKSGQVRAAEKRLGRPYELTGIVVTGTQRGRSIGIPTANAAVEHDRAIPLPGVYACIVTIDDETYQAATNIGFRPTFASDEPQQTVEAHILNFEGDIYGKLIKIAFVERLRGEQKFSGVDALVAQIKADIVRTREVLRETIS